MADNSSYTRRTDDSLSPPPKRPKVIEIESDSEETIPCHNCQHVNLSKAFNDADEYFSKSWDIVLGLREWKDARSTFQGTLVAQLKINSLRRYECALCRFFWNVRLENDTKSCFEIRAFPSYWAIPLIKLNGTTIRRQERTVQPSVLVVIPASQIRAAGVHERFNECAIFRRHLGMTEGTIRAQHVDPHVNFSLFREWISFCTQNHGQGCPKSLPPFGVSPAQDGRVPDIPGFRLIDCEAEEALSMPVSEDYVALSYVWGTVDPDVDAAGTRWPRVVEDAVKVTRSLGFRYLWVDQICIDQQDPKDMARQVERMDVIYQQAKLTIIAAAGPDARFGLAGVDQPRQAPASIRVPGMTLITRPREPDTSIRLSKWWTRGWTYQEGVLSRKRIVFTTEQVYYECGGMVACESLEFPPGPLHAQSLKYQDRLVEPGIFSGVDTRRGAKNPFRMAASKNHESRGDRVRSHITNYAHRDLTHDSDRLNAFLGILSAHKVESYFGILISASQASRISPPSRKRVSLSLGDGSRELMRALVSWWHVDACAARIPQFPSWSWAGWRGRVMASDNGLADPYGYERYPPYLHVTGKPGYPKLLQQDGTDGANSDRQKLKLGTPRPPAIDLTGRYRLSLAGLTLVPNNRKEPEHPRSLTVSNLYQDQMDLALALSVEMSASELISCWGDKKKHGHGWEAIYVASTAARLAFPILRPLQPLQYFDNPERICVERVGLAWVSKSEFSIMEMEGELLKSVSDGYVMQ
ncbi:hypothetical protein ACJZ2D_004575 [Fusarium nematophilum]